MLTTEQALRLGRLQERVYRCIEDELREDPGHKSYEGAIDVTMSLPNIFDRGRGPKWIIELHAYVLSGMSGRHKQWDGATLTEALGAAEHGIDAICRVYEFRRFSREMDAMCDDDAEQSGGISYGDNKHDGDRGPF